MFDDVHEDFLAAREYERAVEIREGRGARRTRVRDAEPYVRFARTVMSWHGPVTEPGAVPMCACGEPGRYCRYLLAAHEFFRMRLPWLPDQDARPLAGWA